MKLYHSSASPNSRRIRILIAEKGLHIELVPVDLGAKEQFSDAYRAINPRLVVPALVLDDGTVIAEVPAIMRYLDEAFPKLPLLGTTPKEKALIAMWERRAELEGFAAVMEGVRNAAPGLKGRAISGPHGYEQIRACEIFTRPQAIRYLRFGALTNYERRERVLGIRSCRTDCKHRSPHRLPHTVQDKSVTRLKVGLSTNCRTICARSGGL